MNYGRSSSAPWTSLGIPYAYSNKRSMGSIFQLYAQFLTWKKHGIEIVGKSHTINYSHEWFLPCSIHCKMDLCEKAYMFNKTNRKFFTQYVYGVFGTIFLDILTFISPFLCWNRWAFHEFCNFYVLLKYFDGINWATVTEGIFTGADHGINVTSVRIHKIMNISTFGLTCFHSLPRLRPMGYRLSLNNVKPTQTSLQITYKYDLIKLTSFPGTSNSITIVVHYYSPYSMTETD
jgi:hypothetical protein